MITTPAFPSLDSSDYYIRINQRELEVIEWAHSYSQRTSISPEEGLTEWLAEIRGLPASISWMWRRGHEGQVVAATPVLVLSNVLVVDAKGHDLTQSLTDELLQTSIAKLPWVQIVASVFARRPDEQLH